MDDRATGRAQRRRDDGGDRCRREQRAGVTTRPDHRLSRLEGAADDRPGAAAGLLLVRSPKLVELHPSRPFSRSRPRRSRRAASAHGRGPRGPRPIQPGLPAPRPARPGLSPPRADYTSVFALQVHRSAYGWRPLPGPFAGPGTPAAVTHVFTVPTKE